MEEAMSVVTIGLDLAKTVFQVHGVDEAGVTVLRRKLARAEMMSFFTKQPPCIVGMEACSSAHHWARMLVEIGHTVRLIPPQYVKPYVKLCSPNHNITNHEVPIMRRNAA
jgi:transposase